MKLKSIRNQNTQSGFSLVELMVVVAIIGILATVAVPQFQNFTYKARLTEARGGLTSLYSAERAFFSEWSEFDERLEAIGYAPEGNYFFNIGFADNAETSGNHDAQAPVPANTDSNVKDYCANTTDRCKTMDSATNSTVAAAATVTPAVAGASGATFIAEARATEAIHPKGIVSVLRINQAKNLTQISGAL